jgi:hypothetical protein
MDSSEIEQRLEWARTIIHSRARSAVVLTSSGDAEQVHAICESCSKSAGRLRINLFVAPDPLGDTFFLVASEHMPISSEDLEEASRSYTKSLE